jgi:hypothetical protein
MQREISTESVGRSVLSIPLGIRREIDIRGGLSENPFMTAPTIANIACRIGHGRSAHASTMD